MAKQPQVASGKQWRDDLGRSLEWLDKAGLSVEAAQVRAAHGRRVAAGHGEDDLSRDSLPKRRRAAGSSEVCSGGAYVDTPDPLVFDNDCREWFDNDSPVADWYADDTQKTNMGQEKVFGGRAAFSVNQSAWPGTRVPKQ